MSLIVNDLTTKKFIYQGNRLVEAHFEQHRPEYADAVYPIHYYDSMVEIEKPNNFLVQAYLENGLLVKKIQGRFYDTDPPFAIWLNEEHYHYNDRGELSKIISTYTDNTDSISWELSYDFHWEDGNISLVWSNGRVMEFTYDDQKNPFRGDIPLVLASEWSIPWAYFNANNVIHSRDWYGFEKSYIYNFSNSVFPTSVTEIDNDITLVTGIGYTCE